MGSLFSLGEWVIDIRREIVSTVFAVIEGYETVYVLESNTDGLYVEKESGLIKYDKYHFDRE